MDRIIVLGGKGGVGKSSISAATAVKLSQLLPNKRILIISFDIAHNLTDLFQKEIGNKITQLNNNLWGIEPDPNIYAEEYTDNLLKKMKAFSKQMPLVGLIPQIETFINTTFTADSIPLALKNAMFFQKILDAEDLTQKIQFDIIIADFPPTGNMIALFEIPEDQVKVVVKYTINFFNSIRKTINNFSNILGNIIHPLSENKNRDELGDEIINMIREVERRGDRVTQLIHEIGSLRLVTIAEKPSYEEMKRAKNLTKKYIDLDGIHINMSTPKDSAEKCNFCENQRTIQLKYIKEIKEEFQNYTIWESQKLRKEPIGFEGLIELANEIYGEKITAEEIFNPKFQN
ncbi:MAG: TRC40/GET3/ArsA family transport-energizing ATPase [Candidatus Lokiarchaeota archaeon]|nr:TRC40/GET3/ArsA family transport-energizing ATPase [Candidatus Lokiarchaeota archaeon]